MDNELITVSSKVGPLVSTKKANKKITEMNDKGYKAIHFDYFSEIKPENEEKEIYYFISILFEKVVV